MCEAAARKMKSPPACSGIIDFAAADYHLAGNSVAADLVSSMFEARKWTLPFYPFSKEE